MNFADATYSFEKWLAAQTPLVKSDLALKHERLKQDHFQFLRGTFYRWVEQWPAACPEAADAPAVLAVGDLHVENFGTWRDREGRLIWGINDFDEACQLPYTNDLTRLAVSARLAADKYNVPVKLSEICDAILSGYLKGLTQGGRPFVLAESHAWLRELATKVQHDPAQFWARLLALPGAAASLPAAARRIVETLLPAPGLSFRVSRRVAGMGSLGRPRWVALADWGGGYVAREIKSAVPSSSWWARPSRRRPPSAYNAILAQAVRIPDPVLHVSEAWIARRLAPDCVKIELATAQRVEDLPRLLEAMGHETANVHAGDRGIASVSRDTKKRPAGWLRTAAAEMLAITHADWQEWRKA